MIANFFMDPGHGNLDSTNIPKKTGIISQALQGVLWHKNGGQILDNWGHRKKMVEMSDEVENRIRLLRETVSHHNERYYRYAEPEISDRQYDRLKRELEDLEREYPEFGGPDSPVLEVGDDRLEGFPSYTHRSPMQSLDNTYLFGELRDFANRLERLLGEDELEFVVEPKIDGMAVSTTYEGGRFVRAVTRGNGTQGDDITANFALIRNYPKFLATPHPEVLEVRGEIYMTLPEFDRINGGRLKEGLPLFANPRNLAAGTVKMLDRKEAKSRRLTWVSHGLGYCDPGYYDTLTNFFRDLKRWNFPQVENHWVRRGIDPCIATITELDGLRKDYAYSTDGAVLKLNRIGWQIRAGSTAKAPRWAIAYKFEAEQVVTRLLDISIQVGRTGALSPVAILEPIQLGGTTVSRATLHNRDEIARKDVRVGDFVKVEKAGEIIPAIVEVVTDKRASELAPYAFPTKCPACQTSVIPTEGEAALRCPNTTGCPPQIRRRIGFFASRQCMDIEGLGEAVVDQLVGRELVASPVDLYGLEKKDLLELDKFAEKSADNLLKALEESKGRELWRLIHGLGIQHVGMASSKLLANTFPDLEKLAGARAEQLMEIEGIGPIVAQSIVAFFGDPTHGKMVYGLIAAGLTSTPALPERSGSIQAVAGKTFVLTGVLPNLKRKEARERIEKAGGKVAGSVSKKTAFLVAGQKAGSKLQAANKLGIKILGERELLELINEITPEF